MTEILIAAFAAAFVVQAVEELAASIGKWRGLLALAVSTCAIFLIHNASIANKVFSSLAGAFISLVALALVESNISVNRIQRLPRRVPPL